MHEDLPLAVRILRDLSGDAAQPVKVDSAETCARMGAFARMFIPAMAGRIDHYGDARPIFEQYGIEEEIQRALERKVPLKSGGHLVIDQTESMTTIDVNTGAYVGHRTLEDTILKTNLEAATVIARQLRLRNLGGIIIIDFIDMDEEVTSRRCWSPCSRPSPATMPRPRSRRSPPLGLVEMTRKRTRESLEHVLCEPCPTCQGRGSLKTPETVSYEVFREIQRLGRRSEAGELRVLAAQDVVDLLLDEESTDLAELQTQVGKSVSLQAEALYNQEQFDVVPI